MNLDHKSYTQLVNLLTKRIRPEFRADVLLKLTEMNNKLLDKIDIDEIINSDDQPTKPNHAMRNFNPNSTSNGSRKLNEQILEDKLDSISQLYSKIMAKRKK